MEDVYKKVEQFSPSNNTERAIKYIYQYMKAYDNGCLNVHLTFFCKISLEQ